MKRLIMLLAVVLACSACSAQLEEKVVETYPDGKTLKVQYCNLMKFQLSYFTS